MADHERAIEAARAEYNKVGPPRGSGHCDTGALDAAIAAYMASIAEGDGLVASLIKSAELFERSNTFPSIAADLRAAAARLAIDDKQPISTAPTDGKEVLVYVAAANGLPAFQCLCAYHPDAGWCADELREVTHWYPNAHLAGRDGVVECASRLEQIETDIGNVRERLYRATVPEETK